MTYRVLSAVAAIAMAAITLSAPPVAAQTSAPGPYYAVPSWDQKLPASTRFLVLSNWNDEAVLDRETGLVWQRTAGIVLEVHFTALQKCHSATTGGRAGWRLPSLHEIRTVLDPSLNTLGQLSLPAGHPFTVGLVWTTSYWTGTSAAEDLRFAYTTPLFIGGGVGVFTKANASAATWCVRGGGPLTVY